MVFSGVLTLTVIAIVVCLIMYFISAKKNKDKQIWLIGMAGVVLLYLVFVIAGSILGF